MSTRPRTRLNVLEMYSIGCDSKNSIPNKTYIWELEMISINYVIPYPSNPRQTRALYGHAMLREYDYTQRAYSNINIWCMQQGKIYRDL